MDSKFIIFKDNEFLIAAHDDLINHYYNKSLYRISNFFENSEIKYPQNSVFSQFGYDVKKIPYLSAVGWRSLNFAEKKLPLGKTDLPLGEPEFIGFMARNKWYYPERYTTAEEFAAIMKILDFAIEYADCLSVPLFESGHSSCEILGKALKELWDLLQSMGNTGSWD